jgi:hypothetical protein
LAFGAAAIVMFVAAAMPEYAARLIDVAGGLCGLGIYFGNADIDEVTDNLPFWPF